MTKNLVLEVVPGLAHPQLVFLPHVSKARPSAVLTASPIVASSMGEAHPPGTRLQEGRLDCWSTILACQASCWANTSLHQDAPTCPMTRHNDDSLVLQLCGTITCLETVGCPSCGQFATLHLCVSHQSRLLVCRLLATSVCCASVALLLRSTLRAACVYGAFGCLFVRICCGCLLFPGLTIQAARLYLVISVTS